MHKEQSELAKRWDLNIIPGAHGKGLGEDRIHYGSNSGYQAINLAYLWGAGQIVLLGYDMQTTGGKQHWFGDHPAGPMQCQSNYSGFMGNFTKLAEDLAARGVDVVNCTRETALTCFRRDSLDNVLRDIRFTISAIDSKGIDAMLESKRGDIMAMIRQYAEDPAP